MRLRRLELGTGALRLGDGDEGGERLGFDLRQPRGDARGAVAGRGDDEQRLAGVEDLVLGEEPVVVEDRADIVLAGDVGGGEDRDHARGGADRGQIEAGQPRMAVGGEAEGEVERAGRLGQIVDIARAARDMALGAVVAERLPERLAKRRQPSSTLTALGARARGRAPDWRRRRGDMRPIRAGR